MKLSLGFAIASFIAWTIALVMLSTPLPPVVHVYGATANGAFIVRVAAVDLERRKIVSFVGTVNDVPVEDDHARGSFDGTLRVVGSAGAREVDLSFRPKPQARAELVLIDSNEIVSRGLSPGMLPVVPAYGQPGANDDARYLVIDLLEPLRWHIEARRPSALGHTLDDGRVMKVKRGAPRVVVEGAYVRTDEPRHVEVRAAGVLVAMGKGTSVEVPKDARSTIAFFDGPFDRRGAQRVVLSRVCKDDVDPLGLCRNVDTLPFWGGEYRSTPERAHRVDPGDAAQIEVAKASRRSRALWARVAFWAFAASAAGWLFYRATRGRSRGLSAKRDVIVGFMVFVAALSVVFGLDWALTLSGA